jgi:hypothetical protein
MEDRAPDAATLKQRLQKRLEEHQKSGERLKAALEKLEKGGDISDVMRDLDQSRPPREGGREGGRDDGREGGPGMGPDGAPPGRELGGPGGGPGGPVTTADREAISKFIAKHMPKVAERMKTFSSLEPDAADRMTMRMAPRILEIMALEEREPKLFAPRVEEMRAGFEIIASSRELADLVRAKGSEKDIAAAEDRVRAAVRARVDAQLKGQEAEIESLANRVDSLREHLKDRTTSKDDRIKDEATRVIERARDPEARGPRGRGESRGEGRGDNNRDESKDSKPGKEKSEPRR